jgi:tetratricopeptide (TPR) repeat protein
MYDDLGDIDKAIQEYKRALKIDYANSIIHLNLAASHIKKNEISEAINELNLAVKFDPEAVEPHAILALLYFSQNKVELATSEYETALKNASLLNPKNIDIYKNLGVVYLQQKKFKDAQNTYRLILDLAPQDASAHFYMANIYDELKDRPAAEKELKKALELSPDYHEALNYLGYLYVEENKNLDQAEAMIKKALEMEPNNGAYIDSLGWLYFRQGKFKEALKELERAIVLLEDPVIYDHLGDAYLKMQDIEKSRDAWQKSLKLKPEQEKVQKKLEVLNKPN